MNPQLYDLIFIGGIVTVIFMAVFIMRQIKNKNNYKIKKVQNDPLNGAYNIVCNIGDRHYHYICPYNLTTIIYDLEENQVSYAKIKMKNGKVMRTEIHLRKNGNSI